MSYKAVSVVSFREYLKVDQREQSVYLLCFPSVLILQAEGAEEKAEWLVQPQMRDCIRTETKTNLLTFSHISSKAQPTAL